MAEEVKETIIAQGTVIQGTISGEQTVVVEGEVAGEINLPKSELIISTTGISNSKIEGDKVLIEGFQKGNVFAHTCIQIAPSGKVKAELKAPEISIEKGAKFSGKIDMFAEEEEDDDSDFPDEGTL